MSKLSKSPEKGSEDRPPRPSIPERYSVNANSNRTGVVVKFTKPANDDDSPEAVTMAESQLREKDVDVAFEPTEDESASDWILTGASSSFGPAGAGGDSNLTPATSVVSSGAGGYQAQPKSSHTRKTLFRSPEERSIISGLKGKLQTNLSAVIGKIDEFYPEAHIGQKIEKRFQKFGSFEDPGHSSREQGSIGAGGKLNKSESENLLQPIQAKKEPVLQSTKNARPTSMNIVPCDGVERPLDDKHETTDGVPRSHSLSLNTTATEEKTPVPSRSESTLQTTERKPINISQSDSNIVQRYRKKEEESFTDAVEQLPAEPFIEKVQSKNLPKFKPVIEPMPLPAHLQKQKDQPHRYRGLANFLRGSVTVALIAVAIALMPLPFSAYTFFAGCWVTYIVLKVARWFEKVPGHEQDSDDVSMATSVEKAFIDQNSGIDCEEGIWRGWVNFSRTYDEQSYHRGITTAVFVELNDTKLIVYYPNQLVPRKVIWSDQPLTDVTFSHSQCFELLGAKVNLLPEDLCNTRRWSKKYPVQLLLSKSVKHNLSVSSGVHSPGHLFNDKEEVDGASSTESDVESEDGKSKRKKSLSAKIKGKLSPGDKKSTNDPDDTSPGRTSPGIKGSGRESPNALLQQLRSAAIAQLGQSSSATDDKAPSGRQKQTVLHFFGRTNREKELWFRRFYYASLGMPYPTDFSALLHQHSLSGSGTSQYSFYSKGKDEVYLDSSAFPNDNTNVEKTVTPPEVLLRNYLKHMGRCLPRLDSNVGHQTLLEELAPVTGISGLPCEIQTVWVNAVIGRLLMDVLQKDYYRQKIMHKIQKKINKLHLPYFIDQPVLSDLNLGSSLPILQKLGLPVLNEQGLWIEMDMNYAGKISFTMETKLNLNKIAERSTGQFTPENLADLPSTSRDMPPQTSKKSNSAANDSDEEDSDDSTEDEDLKEEGSITGKEPTAKRIMRMVNKVSDSPFFKWATEHKVVQKAMTNVSTTRLALSAELNQFTGRVAINIPPPPTDRLWFTFKNNPRLNLSVSPQLGAHDVGKTRIAEFIQKKLIAEFQKVLVYPNMEDIALPILFDNQLPTKPKNESTRVTKDAAQHAHT